MSCGIQTQQTSLFAEISLLAAEVGESGGHEALDTLFSLQSGRNAQDLLKPI